MRIILSAILLNLQGIIRIIHTPNSSRMTILYHTIEGELTPQNCRIALLASRFNGAIVEHLIAGAVDGLKRHGVSDSAIELVWVPGALEMPLVAKKLAKRKTLQAIIALGATIRGATPHFDVVVQNTSAGLARISLEEEIPIIFGVLTTDTIEQAWERAGTKLGNKGFDAALSALEMIHLLQKIS